MLLEHLEDRRLLATAAEPFTGPSLSGLISQAFHGKDTAEATIKTMLSALQTQLTDGPLTALSSGAVKGNVFVSEAQSLVASYNQNVDQQLLPHFTHIDNMLKLQGQQVVANLVSLYQQSTVGTPTTLILSGYLPLQAGAAINTLTKGPIYSLNTPVSGYVTATQTFETNLGVVANTLSSTATPTLTLPQVSTTIQGEAEAYRASMDAGLQVTHSNLSSTVNAAVTTLEDTVITIANANSSTAQADIHSAIAAFDSTILDTTGLFGLNGPVIQVNSELGYVPHNLTGKQAATTISVSGTATFGGPATLTATLKSATGTGLIGKVVSFTLDGAFAGTAVTDSNGIATLTGVTQNDTVSTPGTIVARFAGDSTNLLSQNSGNLVVSQSSTTTTLASSANPSASGQSVTFTATVAAVSPGSGTPTGTVNFLDGTTQIGTGTLSSTGAATFSTTTLTTGTHSITAVYEGDTNFTTSTSSVLSQVVLLASTTTLTASPTSSVFGQPVTFTATVAAVTSGSGTPTGTVNFLNGTT
ncbi:MAG: Ig-like domain-containing protein, partial [Isosphaeraceae bacterium]